MLSYPWVPTWRIGLFGVHSLTCSRWLCTGKFWKLLKTAAVSAGLCWRQYWSYLAQKKWEDHYLECHSSQSPRAKSSLDWTLPSCALKQLVSLDLLGEEHFFCSSYSSVWLHLLVVSVNINAEYLPGGSSDCTYSRAKGVLVKHGSSHFK